MFSFVASCIFYIVFKRIVVKRLAEHSAVCWRLLGGAGASATFFPNVAVSQLETPGGLEAHVANRANTSLTPVRREADRVEAAGDDPWRDA